MSRLKAQLRQVHEAEMASRLAAEQTLQQLQQEFGAGQPVSTSAHASRSAHLRSLW